MIFFLFVFQIVIHAQCILNNIIEAVSPICTGSKALVKGSLPTGGNGTFQYSWQVNAHDCGSSFEDIAGANGPNYVVPNGLAVKCIRRIVKSGACPNSESNKADIAGINPDPTAPTVKLNRNASTNTGNIIVTNPIGTGFNYSIDGINYTNTTGIFSDVSLNSYSVTAKVTETCISPSTNVVLSIEETPLAPVVGMPTQPTCTVPTGSVDLSGLPASGTWTLTRNPDGVTTYTGTGTTFTVNGLPAGATYTFTVTDADGNVSAASADVVIDPQPASPTAPVVGTITQPTCATATGSVALSSLPASGSWTLTRNPGAVTSTGSGTTTTVSGLAANATYTFTVTNAAGCTSPASGDVAIIAQPASPTAPVVGTITQPTCATATGSVPLSGLPTPGTWTLTRNPGGVTTTGNGASNNVSSLPAGATYSFTVTNAQGCTSPASVNVIVNAQPSAPAAPSATVTQQPTCSVASGTVTITSITTGVLFSVDGGGYASYPAGGYQLAAGSHNIRARNASDNTCISPQTTVTVNSQPPTPAQPAATVTQQPNCTIPTGTITITSPAPATGITYSVDGTTYTNTSGVFTGLVPATYSVTVKNSDGCISTPRSLTVNPVPASSLSASATTVDIICGVNTGTIIVTAAGGVPPYTYSLNGAAATILNIFSGLGAGTYTIKITDAIGCAKEITAVIDILNSTLTATASVTNVACGGTTGSAVISASGGTPPYNYSLDGGSFGTASGFPNLTAGAHSVKVKDALNCTFDVSVNILAAPIPPAPTATATQPTCLVATGTISITTPAPASGISYSINGTDYSNTSGVFPGLAPGNYNVTYKNSAGCTSAALNVIINSQPPTPAQPIASVSQQPDCSIVTGTITVTQPAPATGISYSIDGANYTNNTGVFTGIAPGNYNVTVKNSSGCVSPALTLTVNAVLAPPGAPTVTVTTQPSCSVATGNVTITSATTGLEFSIDNGTFVTYPASGYDLSSGTHNIRARRTSDNCISLAAGITIQDIPNAPASPIISVSQQPTCSVTTGTVIITSSTANLEFSVDGGTYSVYPNGGYQLSPGNHTITARSITDINCISTAANVTVNSSPGIPSAPTLSITQPTCSVATGTVIITSATAGLQFSLD